MADIPLFTINYRVYVKWPNGYESVTIRPRTPNFGPSWTFTTIEQLLDQLEHCTEFGSFDTFMTDGVGALSPESLETVDPLCRILQTTVTRGQVTLNHPEQGEDFELYVCLRHNELYASGYMYSAMSHLFIPSYMTNISECRMFTATVDNVVRSGPITIASGSEAEVDCKVNIMLHPVNAFQLSTRPRVSMHPIVRVWMQLMKNDREAKRLKLLSRYLYDVHSVGENLEERWTSTNLMEFLLRYRSFPEFQRDAGELSIGHYVCLNLTQLIDLQEMMLQEGYTFDSLQWQAVTNSVQYSHLYNIFRRAQDTTRFAGGILASPSGSGKTRTCISLALSRRGVSATLVIAKQMSIAMWETELRHVSLARPDLVYHIMDGSETCPGEIMRRNVIVVCTSSVYLKKASRFPAHRIIVDDGHNINPEVATKIAENDTCTFRWVVTSTPIHSPPNYQNTSRILDLLKINNDVLWDTFGPREFPTRMFALVGLVSIRHTTSLPGANVDHRVCEVKQSPHMMNIYRARSHKLRTSGYTPKAFDDICSSLSRGKLTGEGLYKLVPEEVKDQIRYDECCCICFDPLLNPVMLNCGNMHTVCFACSHKLEVSPVTTCPICRGTFTEFKLCEPLQSGNSSPKLTALVNIIRNVPGKVVVFTRFKQVVRELPKKLKHLVSRKVFYVNDVPHTGFSRHKGPAVLVARFNGVSSGTSFVSEDERNPVTTIVMFEPSISTVDTELALARVDNLASQLREEPQNIQVVQLLYAGTVEENMHYFHVGAYDHDDVRITGHRAGLSAITSAETIQNLFET